MREWSEAVAPLVRKCEVAAIIDGEAVWNATGAAALGKLLKDMARLLDDEVKVRHTADDL